MSRALVTTTIVGTMLLTSSCGSHEPTLGAPDHVVTMQGSNGIAERLHVWVADDDAERAKGLMGVSQLAPSQGMAFLFDGPSIESFWMKDTLIPLSVAFVDAKGTIVTIRRWSRADRTPAPRMTQARPTSWRSRPTAGGSRTTAFASATPRPWRRRCLHDRRMPAL